MQNLDDCKEVLPLLKKHLQVQPGEPLEIATSSLENTASLKGILSKQIAWMLDFRFERLLQAMYRIDVAEQDFKEVLSGAAPVAAALADLVINRELKKLETRRLYSQ